ncbi:MAG TPA: ABC transporter [Lachnoclostridium phytofermentans]|uniref:ABC transporter n=1 Tax=Lachnoclostridium phytofermentans TaxID=66219 RepID=A0A3D2X3D1_9FIRM|nr:carbohydrate ABC transporter permease [Lachnoclostridium sp.]HCL01612.1 ABC transporter [Lachnoclostridium phytofermentans]
MRKKIHVPQHLAKIITYIALILLAMAVVVPVAWSFMAAFKQNHEFYGNPWILPEKLYFQNFVSAWEEARMGEFMLNSVITTVLGLLMLLITALPAAYVLSRFNFKVKKILRALFMGGLFININYIVVPIFLMFADADKWLKSVGLKSFFLNNIFVLAVVYASTALPFTIYLLSSYFITIPKAYEEAAYIDGAGYVKTMIKVIFPMAKPSIITVILFNFLWFWNEYIIAITLLTDPKGAKTLPVGLMNLMKAQNAAAQYGRMYAGLVLVMVPTLVFYICVQKKLTQSLNIGGLKG